MKTVNELNQNELEELRSRWYSQHEDDGSLEEVAGTDEDGDILSEEEIPMIVIKAYYEGTYFVEDDFFCNIED